MGWGVYGGRGIMTLYTHEIVTGERSPEVGANQVRRWYDVGAKEVERLYRYDKGSEKTYSLD